MQGEIAEKVRRRRASRKLKQREVADQAGISLRHYQRVERAGTRNLELVDRIASALGTTRSELL